MTQSAAAGKHGAEKQLNLRRRGQGRQPDDASTVPSRRTCIQISNSLFSLTFAIISPFSTSKFQEATVKKRRVKVYSIRFYVLTGSPHHLFSFSYLVDLAPRGAASI
ncbi:hypothetical protein VKT23_003914 [Stygiomarasmius scandens]|uniref:Uncharacterized protein n=1 Tax=Marasmiellus scandens TaxID=2682957 RepID=A0ABR1K519_9AGAR